MTTPPNVHPGSRHPEFQAALDRGDILPAPGPDTGPDGHPLPFLLDGVPYYCAADQGTRLYQGRWLHFSDVLDRHDRLKLDEDLLRGLLLTVRESALAATTRLRHDPDAAADFLAEIITLTRRTEQRLALYADLHALGLGALPSRVLDLAALWYFTEDEDPATLDPTIRERKIRHWHQHPPLYAFFLRTPLSHFVALPVLSPASTRTSLAALAELNHLDYLTYAQTLLQHKTHGTTDATITSLASLTATLSAYTNYSDYLSNLFTTTPPTDIGSPTATAPTAPETLPTPPNEPLTTDH